MICHMKPVYELITMTNIHTFQCVNHVFSNIHPCPFSEIQSDLDLCICLYIRVLAQRAAQQLKSHRQLEEAFESRLQLMQTTAGVPRDTPLATDSNSGELPFQASLITDQAQS